jgi:hypothetical protein
MSKIEVDHRGLQAIVRERGEVTLLDELVQNALDTNAKVITVEISSPATNRVRIEVIDDDPLGYVDLSHAYTLFAPSVKRDDASKRGFMNVGDKLAVAYAVAGRITSTSGSVIIDGDERRRGTKRTDVGSHVDLTFPMSKATMSKLIERARTYLITEGVTFTVNGEVLPGSMPSSSTKTRLGLYVEKDGDMQVSQLVTQLDLYEPDTRGSWIYVLGIPVERIDELPVSVDVRGRLKADIKRDQVPARELHRIKVAIADHLAAELTHEDVTGWARSTMADASPAVVQRIVAETFGVDAMVANPSDQQANIRATEEGRTLIPTRAFSSAEWQQVRELRAADPSFAPTTSSEYGAITGGSLSEAIPPDEWPPMAVSVAGYAQEVFAELFPGCKLQVSVHDGGKIDCIATMRREVNHGHLTLIVGDWFSDQQEVLDTIIHEFAHFEADGHGHSIRWGEACASVGARIALLGMLP